MKRIWDLLAAVALFAMVYIVVVHWSEAPDRVPSHFNAQGEADRWTGPYRLWFMPAVAAALYLLLTTVARRLRRTGDPAREAVADGLLMTNALVMIGSLWMHTEVWMIALGFLKSPGPASFIATIAAGVFGLALSWWRYRRIG